MLPTLAGATSPILVYLAAPIGAPDAAGVEAHLWDAGRWLRYLVDLPDARARQVSWCLPWYAYASHLDDRLGPYRARGLRDTMAVLQRCDAIAAVCGLSPGVRDELALAESLGLPVLNLVAHGPQPPPMVAPQRWARDPHKVLLGELHAMVAAVEARRWAAMRPSA